MNSLSPRHIAELLRAISSDRYEELPVPSEDGGERELVQALNRIHRDRQEHLRGAEARNRLIIDSTPVAICITNEHGLYEYVNPRYRQLTGYSAEELLGRSFLTVVPPAEQANLKHLHDEFMGQRYELAGQWEIVTRSGRTVPILASAAYIIDVDGRPKKITFVVDISEIRDTQARLEAEIEERRRLEQMREEVERVMRHDLRNPIDGIRTAADYLLQEDLDERSAEFVRLMYDAAVRARTRIDNSLAYTRMQRGEYRIRRERVNGVQLVRDALASVEETRAAFRVEVVPWYRDRPLSAVFDVEMWGENGFLTDAVTNLVRNAIEASGEGDTISVVVDDTLTMPDGTPAVTVSVLNPADVPAEIRDTLFDAYVTHGKSGGTGLGTYTARLVATAHGGDIVVETGQGSGTTMRLIVPRGRPGEIAS